MPAPGWLSMGDPVWLRLGDPGGSACPTPVAHYGATADNFRWRRARTPFAAPVRAAGLASADRCRHALMPAHEAVKRKVQTAHRWPLDHLVESALHFRLKVGVDSVDQSARQPPSGRACG